MNPPATPLSPGIKALSIGAVIAPWLGIVVRLFTGSIPGIIFCGVALWLFGATVVGFLAARLSSKPSSVVGQILLWTIAPFVPLYAVAVLVTGAVLRH